MAQKGIDLKNVRIHHKIWLETIDSKGIMGDGKWQILKAIDENCSLKAACEQLGLTYRRTWGDLKKIETMLGFPLLEKSRGGREGGMSRLSPQGKMLVDAFNEFHASVDPAIHEALISLKKKLTEL